MRFLQLTDEPQGCQATGREESKLPHRGLVPVLAADVYSTVCTCQLQDSHNTFVPHAGEACCLCEWLGDTVVQHFYGTSIWGSF